MQKLLSYRFTARRCRSRLAQQLYWFRNLNSGSLCLQEETLRKQHQAELLAQIAAAEEQRKVTRQNYLEEGRRVRLSADEYLQKVQGIKEAKLAELRAQGVPEKYCAELARYKVGQSGH